MSTEGNKFEPAAAQNVLALFLFDDWAKVKNLLGVMQKDMKSALRTAVRQTGQWANREGARGLAKATNTPLKVLRQGLRVKFQYQSVKGFSTARLWYGLNSISVKHLGAKQQKKGVRARGATYRGGFISPKLGGHAFQRVGKARVPLAQISHDINDKGQSYLSQFETSVAAKFVELFFLALDKVSGREAGESEAIAGSLNISRK